MNHPAHCIRLRPPWEGSGETSSAATRRVRLRRRFGRPTGIGLGDGIWLAIEPSKTPRVDDVVRDVVVTLNGGQLGPLDLTADTTRWNVTARLDQRNELVIEYTDTAPGAVEGESRGANERADRGALPEWLGEVRLEIVTDVVDARRGCS